MPLNRQTGINLKFWFARDPTLVLGDSLVRVLNDPLRQSMGASCKSARVVEASKSYARQEVQQ